MASGTSVVSRQKFVVSFSLLFILLLSSVLYFNFPGPANAEAEASKSSVAAAAGRLQKVDSSSKCNFEN